MSTRILPFVLPLLLIPAAGFAAEPPARETPWSKEIKGLSGRLAAEKISTPRSGHVKLNVELWNRGSIPLVVWAHDPFGFDLVVKDAAGKVIESHAQRAEILSSPQAGVIPRDSRLAVPVTLQQAEEGKWNLDITTKLWKLTPGRYRLSGTYQVQATSEPGGWKDEKQAPWHGEIRLAEIEIEITE